MQSVTTHCSFQNLVTLFFLFQNLPADIKESITDIIKFMLQREYVKVHYHAVHQNYVYEHA